MTTWNHCSEGPSPRSCIGPRIC